MPGGKGLPAWLPIAIFAVVLALAVASIGLRFNDGQLNRDDLRAEQGDFGDLSGLDDLERLDILQDPAAVGELRNETGAKINESVVFQGSGEPLVKPIFEMTGGLLRVEVEHAGEFAYFKVNFERQGGSEGADPFIGTPEFGPYKAIRYIGLDAGTYELDVRADGYWRIEITYPSAADARSAAGSFGGDSMQPAPPVELPAGATDVRFIHSGDYRHNVRVFDWAGNELGDASGCWFFGRDADITRTCVVPRAGPYFFDVEADRGWTLEFTSA